MKGRGGSGGGPPADLLVCFPARAHLALMPKPICSPSRSTDGPKRHASRSATRGQASPLFRTKVRNAAAAAEVISEPTSPKVTCAGQIKVSRPKAKPPAASTAAGTKSSWLAVMEEMEELRRRQRRRRGHWLDALGLKRDAMHLLHALRGLRLHMRCFGFRGPAAGCTSDEEDDDSAADEEEEEDEGGKHGDAPQTIFSKWFMLLEESPNGGSLKRKVKDEEEEEEDLEEEEEEEREGAFGGCLVTPASPSTSSSAPPPPPPPNALLLMRCRSAPAQGWLSNGGTGVDDEAAGGAGEGEVTARMIKEDEKEKERLVLMSYAPDFFKVSPEIAKETWLVGSFDPLSRSRSWKR